MLTMTDSDGDTYYLDTTNGNVYTKQFVDSGYKDKIASGQATVAAGDAVGKVGVFGTTKKVSDYFRTLVKSKTVQYHLREESGGPGSRINREIRSRLNLLH